MAATVRRVVGMFVLIGASCVGVSSHCGPPPTGGFGGYAASLGDVVVYTQVREGNAPRFLIPLEQRLVRFYREAARALDVSVPATVTASIEGEPTDVDVAAAEVATTRGLSTFTRPEKEVRALAARLEERGRGALAARGRLLADVLDLEAKRRSYILVSADFAERRRFPAPTGVTIVLDDDRRIQATVQFGCV